MVRTLIADSNQHETRVAVLEDDVLAEIYTERKESRRLVGNIYLGRVANVLPGMDAAFVDVGLDKNAFLHAGDVLMDRSEYEFGGKSGNLELKNNIRSMVRQGQYIMVQVLKEPVGNKGAKVTTHITLPGRMVVLMPTVDYIGVSRRIEGEEERARLKEIMERMKPEHMGVIVRTVAEGKQPEDFEQEFEYLTRLWEKIKKEAEGKKKPRPIHLEGEILYRSVRDLFTTKVQRYVADRNTYDQVLSLTKVVAPSLAERVERYSGPDLFEVYNVESKILKALNEKVWLKSGGYLIINNTEALTVIDVNTGKYVGSQNLQDTIFQTNQEAAVEIARQLRLRDISGIIVIDFIDMESLEHREAILETLEETMKMDRTKSNVIGMTGLGLVEMTRKKSRRRLSARLEVKCPCCGGSGKILSAETVALQILRKALILLNSPDYEAVLVHTSRQVAHFIEEASKEEPFFPDLHGKKVFVKTMREVNPQYFEIDGMKEVETRKDCVVYG